MADRGIKETKELLKALCTTGGFVGKRLKDGPDVGDLIALAKWILFGKGREVFKGVEGIDKVPKEIKDLTPGEIQEIGAYVLAECLPEVLEAFKK